MQKELIAKESWRECEICFFKQWNPHEFDGYSYSYEIIDRENNTRTDQTDEYPCGSIEHAKRKALESIDEALDDLWAISCLATKRGKHQHFAMSIYGEKAGAIAAGKKKLESRYPEWKHSVSVTIA